MISAIRTFGAAEPTAATPGIYRVATSSLIEEGCGALTLLSVVRRALGGFARIAQTFSQNESRCSERAKAPCCAVEVFTIKAGTHWF